MAGMSFAPHAAAVLATLSAACAIGLGGCVLAVRYASRQRAAAFADRRALRCCTDSASTFAEAAFRLTDAARRSADDVRAEIARACFAAAAAADGVLVYEEHDGALCCVAAFGERFAYFAESAVAVDDARALPSLALQRGHHVTLADDDAPDVDSSDGARALHPGDNGAVAIPLSLEARRRCVLVLCAASVLHSDDVRRLLAVARQSSPAYLIALDREQDRYDAEYDGLTGLLTPRAFRRRLSALVDGMRFTPAACLGLLFVDTDHFKRWNDVFGHAAGDALLRELANVFRAGVAPGDLVGRNGGDEFCLVFAGAGKAAAIERAARLRRAIAALDARALLPPQAHGPARVTASIGVAAYPADAASASELLERADAAMYHTKQRGRNGVSYADERGFVLLRDQ